MHSGCGDASAYIKNYVQIRNNKTVCSLIGLIYNHCWRMKKWPKMHAKCMHFSMHMSIYIVNAPYGHFLCCPYQIKMVFLVTFNSLTLYLHQKVFQCMLKLCWMLVFNAEKCIKYAFYCIFFIECIINLVTSHPHNVYFH